MTFEAEIYDDITVLRNCRIFKPSFIRWRKLLVS